MEWSSVRRPALLSVPDRLAVDLERLILEGELKPGDRLPTEQELGQHFGVSRVSVRQALHQLDARGLIDRKPGRGTTVRSAASRGGQAGSALTNLMTSTASGAMELAQIMELRAIIEPPIAALAAERLTQGDTEQLRDLVEEMERESDLERYAELDRIFHQAISQYTHNPLLAQLTDLIATEIAPSRRRAVQSPERKAASSVAHRRIFEALAEHDPARAEAEAHAHVESVLREALLAASSKESHDPEEQG